MAFRGPQVEVWANKLFLSATVAAMEDNTVINTARWRGHWSLLRTEATPSQLVGTPEIEFPEAIAHKGMSH